MVNKWIGIGNLGRDPELRSTPNGGSVCNLNLACSEKFKDKAGELKERTEWVSVVVWGKDAENVARFCKKGKQVYVEGRLETRKWQDKDGKDRYTTEVVANVVRFLGGAGEGGGGSRQGGSDGGGHGRNAGNAGNTAAAPDSPPWSGDDQDIPF